MKILAISDIHGDKGLVKRMAKQAKKENVDLVILAGDLTWFEQSTENLIGPFVKEGKEVLIIPGNHESEEAINLIEKTYKGVKSIHKKHFKKDDVAFFGTGTVDWGFYSDSKQVYNELKNAHDKIKNYKKKIMVTHSNPEGSKLELLGFPGSRGIKKAIDKFKPDILICGHIHEGGGIAEKIAGTTVFNVSRKPTIFEI
jgi:Icc-related predicted phosphoesterase